MPAFVAVPAEERAGEAPVVPPEEDTPSVEEDSLLAYLQGAAAEESSREARGHAVSEEHSLSVLAAQDAQPAPAQEEENKRGAPQQVVYVEPELPSPHEAVAQDQTPKQESPHSDPRGGSGNRKRLCLTEEFP